MNTRYFSGNSNEQRWNNSIQLAQSSEAVLKCNFYSMRVHFWFVLCGGCSSLWNRQVFATDFWDFSMPGTHWPREYWCHQRIRGENFGKNLYLPRNPWEIRLSVVVWDSKSIELSSPLRLMVIVPAADLCKFLHSLQQAARTSPSRREHYLPNFLPGNASSSFDRGRPPPNKNS